MSDPLEQLKVLLEADANRPFPKYPLVTRYILRDHKVEELVKIRFSKNSQIVEVSDHGYSFRSGLLSTYFEFTPTPTSVAQANAFLVLSDGDGKVIGIVDPFDRQQPNPQVPPLPLKGEQPFAFARPLCKEQVFTSSEMYPVEVRNREFFEKLRLITAGSPLSPGDNVTRCIFQTNVSGPRGRCYSYTESAVPFAPYRCDEYVTETTVTTDELLDDSGLP